MKKYIKVQNLICKMLLAGTVVIGIFMYGCSNENEILISMDDETVNSVELEEYIITASDFKQSFALFEKELGKVDFSKLEITYDADGREVMHLPASAGSIRIEEKIQIFNEKKQALLEKYPQFAYFTSDESNEYFQQCIQNSLSVNNKLLEMGINVFRPLLKGGTVENWNSGNGWLSFLSSWVNNSNYVEVYLIAHSNGTYSTWVDDRNTANSAYLTYSKKNGKYYFTQGGNTNSISWIAHTHRNSQYPSGADMTTKSNIARNISQYLLSRSFLCLLN
jgi:hypothetical protein